MKSWVVLKIISNAGISATPPNFRVCARRKVPTKHFKICHIYENGKGNFGFSYVWQILKRFVGTFRRAQTLKLGGVVLNAHIIRGIKNLKKTFSCGILWN